MKPEMLISKALDNKPQRKEISDRNCTTRMNKVCETKVPARRKLFRRKTEFYSLMQHQHRHDQNVHARKLCATGKESCGRKNSQPSYGK
jgi:hypothetical protein